MKKLRFSKSLLVACAVMIVGLGRDPAVLQDSLSGTTGLDMAELADVTLKDFGGLQVYFNP